MRLSLVLILALAVTAFGSLHAQQKQQKAPTPPNAGPQTTAAKQPQMGPTPGPGPGPDTLVETRNPLDGDRAAIGEGRRLFKWYNCAGCHGDHAGGGMGPSLRDSTWIYGNTDARIFNSIAQGRTKGMPSWGAKLPPDQIWKLVAYIKSLRTSKEPDRP